MKKTIFAKITLTVFVCMLVVLNILILTQYIQAKQKNQHYKKAINYLIDDQFVKAEQYIKNNKLHNDVNYEKLVKKINTPPTIRLNNNSITGKSLDWKDEYWCKRFKNSLSICNK